MGRKSKPGRQSKKGPNPNLCPRTLFEVPNSWMVSTAVAESYGQEGDTRIYDHIQDKVGCPSISLRAGGVSRLGFGTRCAALRTAPRLCGKLRRRLLTRGIAPGCPQCRPRKSLSRPREAKTLISARLGDQAALSKMFFILVLIGAVISVVSFCAIPVRCRVCSASASICLRACSVDNSTNADGVFTPST